MYGIRQTRHLPMGVGVCPHDHICQQGETSPPRRRRQLVDRELRLYVEENSGGGHRAPRRRVVP